MHAIHRMAKRVNCLTEQETGVRPAEPCAEMEAR